MPSYVAREGWYTNIPALKPAASSWLDRGVTPIGTCGELTAGRGEFWAAYGTAPSGPHLDPL
eukprot:1004383-Prorocentrum_minimum.AAC.1